MKISPAPTASTTAQPHPDGDARLPESSPRLSVPYDTEVNQRILENECARKPCRGTA
jgi:hypothetical protein